MAHWL